MRILALVYFLFTASLFSQSAYVGCSYSEEKVHGNHDGASAAEAARNALGEFSKHCSAYESSIGIYQRIGKDGKPAVPASFYASHKQTCGSSAYAPFNQPKKDGNNGVLVAVLHNHPYDHVGVWPSTMDVVAGIEGKVEVFVSRCKSGLAAEDQTLVVVDHQTGKVRNASKSRYEKPLNRTENLPCYLPADGRSTCMQIDDHCTSQGFDESTVLNGIAKETFGRFYGHKGYHEKNFEFLKRLVSSWDTSNTGSSDLRGDIGSGGVAKNSAYDIDTSRLEALMRKQIEIAESMNASGKRANNIQISAYNSHVESVLREIVEIDKRVEALEVAKDEKLKIAQTIISRLRPIGERIKKLMDEAVAKGIVAGIDSSPLYKAFGIDK